MTALFTSLLSMMLWSQAETPQAFLRYDSQGQAYVEVVGRVAPVVVTVFAGTEVVTSAKVETGPIRIALQAVPSQGMTVVLQGRDLPESTAALLNVEVDVGLQLMPSPSCQSLGVVAEVTNDSDYAKARLALLHAAMGNLKRQDILFRVEPANRQGAVGLRVSGPLEVLPGDSSRAQTDGGFVACLRTDPLPAGLLDAEVKLTSAIPELSKPFLKTDLTVSQVQGTPVVFPSKDEAPGTRAVEKNLDLAILGTSNLSQPAADGTRQRVNRTTVDLRFAPILNWRPGLGNLGTTRTLHYVTPFFVDAKIATGELTKETAATNTVVFGGEYELRHFSNTDRFPTFHRLIIRGSNASDRKFERAEIKAAVEWRPLFGALNRPKGTQDTIAERDLDRDPQRPPKVLTTQRGVEIQPLLGVETGHTYRWTNAPAGVEQKPNFVRGYFGVAATVDFSSWLRFRLNEVAYLRSEDVDDRLHNYVNVAFELPIATAFSEAVQALFVSYEKGGLPPFSTADVDAFKIGYRIQWAGWFDRYR